MSSGVGGGIRRRGPPPLRAAAAKRVRLTQHVSTSQPPPLPLPAVKNPMAAEEDEAEMLLLRCNEVAKLIHRDGIFACGLLRCKHHALPDDLAFFFSHTIDGLLNGIFCTSHASQKRGTRGFRLCFEEFPHTCNQHSCGQLFLDLLQHCRRHIDWTSCADEKSFLVLPFHKSSFDIHCAGQDGHFLVGTDDIQRYLANRIIELSEKYSSLPYKASCQCQARVTARDTWELFQPRQESRGEIGSAPFHAQQAFDAKARYSGDKSVMKTQVFVKHLYGTLSLQVDAEEDVQLFKEEVQQRMHLDVSQFIFIYGLQILESGKKLSFYGIEKDSTISLRARCRGGRRYQTLLVFYQEHENELLRTVQLPYGFSKVELTELGVILLSSLIQLFTSVFLCGKTWDGKFDLGSFIVICGRVKIKLPPWNGLTSSSIHNDSTGLAKMIRRMFVKDEYPPYLHHLLQKLDTLAVDVFTADLQLAFNCHLSLILSLNRASLVYLIKTGYDGWSENEKQRFRDAVNSCKVPDDMVAKLKETPLFCDVIAEGSRKGVFYMDGGHGAFRLVRNYNTHAPKHTWAELMVDKISKSYQSYQWCKCNNGIELMVEKYLESFLAEALDKLIEDNFDIKDMLLACSGVFNILDSALSTSPRSSSSSDSSSSSSDSHRKGKGNTSVSMSQKRKRIDLSSSLSQSQKKRKSHSISSQKNYSAKRRRH